MGIIVISTIAGIFQKSQSNGIIYTVDKGEVSEVISVSGFVEAKNTAELGFPATGIVTEVFVDEGQVVTEGEVLATMASARLVAQRNSALAVLKSAELDYAQASREQSDQAIYAVQIENAGSTVEQTISEYNERLANAKLTLLSSDLEARAINGNETAAPPTITGTYTCDTEGSYIIEVYQSSAASGFSYRVSGLENSTGSGYTNQPGSLGKCGLSIQFTEGEVYNGSRWEVTIPNTNGQSYITNKNTYELLLQQQSNAITSAQNNLNLTATEANAALRSRQAAVNKARADLAAIDADLQDRSVVAPFAGMVTSVDIVKGETATPEPIITVLAEDAFELKARIPEIDITKLQVGQSAEAVFDARANDTVRGIITYVSPLAEIIDGVAYFQATISLNEVPKWLRSGLNADVNIIIKSEDNVARIPKRFIYLKNEEEYVDVLREGKRTAVTVEVAFRGNDGMVAVLNLNEGDKVLSPE